MSSQNLRQNLLIALKTQFGTEEIIFENAREKANTCALIVKNLEIKGGIKQITITGIVGISENCQTYPTGHLKYMSLVKNYKNLAIGDSEILVNGDSEISFQFITDFGEIADPARDKITNINYNVQEVQEVQS